MKKIIFGSVMLFTGILGVAFLIALVIIAEDYHFPNTHEPFVLQQAIANQQSEMPLLIFLIIAIIGFTLCLWKFIENQGKGHKEKMIVGGSMLLAGILSIATLSVISRMAGQSFLRQWRIDRPYIMYMLTRFWYIERHQLQLPLSILAVIAAIGFALLVWGVVEMHKDS